MDSFGRVEVFADGCVVVEGVNQERDVFAHVGGDVPFATQKFRRLIYEVRRDYAVD